MQTLHPLCLLLLLLLLQVTYAEPPAPDEEAQGPLGGGPRIPRVRVFRTAWLRRHHIEATRTLLAALIAFAAASVVMQLV